MMKIAAALLSLALVGALRLEMSEKSENESKQQEAASTVTVAAAAAEDIMDDPFFYHGPPAFGMTSSKLYLMLGGFICLWAAVVYGTSERNAFSKLSCADYTPMTETFERNIFSKFWCADVAPMTCSLEWTTSIYFVLALMINLGGFTAREGNALVLPEFRQMGEFVSQMRLLCVVSMALTALLGPMVKRWNFFQLGFNVLCTITCVSWLWLTQTLVQQRNFHSVYMPVWTMVGITISIWMQSLVGPNASSSFLQKFLLVALSFTYINSGLHKVEFSGLGWDPTRHLTCCTDAPLFNVAVWMKDMGLGRLVGIGTLTFEILVAPAAIFVAPVRIYFYLMSLGFHVGIYALMGPNFLGQALVLVILAGIPQLTAPTNQHVSRKSNQNSAGPAEILLGVMGTMMAMMWMYANGHDQFAKTYFLTSDMMLFV